MLQYLIPGYIFIVLTSYFFSKRPKNQTFILIWSIVISFLIQSFFYALHLIIFTDTVFPRELKILITTVFSVVLAFLVIWLEKTNVLNKLSAKLFRRTLRDDFWSDIIDSELGTQLKVFLKSGVIYTGKLALREEKGMDSFFAFSDYFVRYPDGRTFKAGDVEIPSVAVIPLREIERAELFYNPSTKVILFSKKNK